MPSSHLLLILPLALGYQAIIAQEAAPASLAQDNVVVQPAAQILQDLKGSGVPASPPLQAAGSVVSDLSSFQAEEKSTSGSPPLTTDQELARLHALPASTVPLRQARLIEAIQALAEEAAMKYIAPSEADFGERVTLNVRLNPKELLDVLSDNF